MWPVKVIAGLTLGRGYFIGQAVLLDMLQEQPRHGPVHRAGLAWARIVPGQAMLVCWAKITSFLPCY